MNVFEKIVERLEEQRVKYEHGGDDDYLDGKYDAASKDIEIVQEVAEEYKNGWIPCSERLPEESLNSMLGFDAYRERCCFVQYYDGRWHIGNDIESVKITAWQPLPEPYKEGE